MLRGSSRHDGIPNKQSARERDRDRLRERQRQERQQMLPNDEKEINVGAQDLFHAPVKVKPSVEDSTTAQIANTLGSFDTVRHLILDTSQRRLGNLIGVDQGSLPGTPVANRNPAQALISGHTADQGSVKPPYFHAQPVASQPTNQPSAEVANKGHHRGHFSTANTSNSTVTNHSVGGSHNSLTKSATSSTAEYFPGNYRVSSNPQPTQNQNQNHNQKGHTYGPPSSHHNNSSTSNHISTHLSNNSTSSHNSSGSGGTNPSGGTNSAHAASATNNNQVRTNPSNNSNSAKSAVTEVNAEQLTVVSAKTVTNAVVKEQDSASGAPEKTQRNASSNRKPALERADSQLEIESMLKEMMDITAPLTAIQTPVKESSTKKFVQRRSSKSEEKIVQSIRDSGMADVPSPVKRMDSSSDSGSSYDESETSDSESEDSSSGSQNGGDKIDTVPKITPISTNSPTRWNLGSFIRKNDYRGTPADTNTNASVGGSKSETKPNAHQVNSINSETSPGDAPLKTEPVVSSTSLFNKAQSLSPLDTPKAPTPPTRKITRSTAEAKPEPYVPPKPPPATGTSKSTNSVPKQPVVKSLSGSSSEEESEKPPKKEASRPLPPPEQDKGSSASGAGKRKRKRSSSSSERSNLQKPPPPPPEEISPESNAAKNQKNVQDRKKNDTIRRLFKLNKKVDSPTRDGELGKSPSGPHQPNTNGNAGSGPTASASNSKGGVANVPGTKGSPSSNRVQAKDSGKKKGGSSTHNGELDIGAPQSVAVLTESPSKKREESKGKDSSSSKGSHGKKNQKSVVVAGSSSKSITNIPHLLPPPPPAAKIKEELITKPDKASAMSSLVVKITLSKLKRKPLIFAPPLPPPPLVPVKLEKDIEKGKGKELPSATSNNADLFKRVHNSSRVGSSSDHAKDGKGGTSVAHNQPTGRLPPDGLCSEIDSRGKKRNKSKKVKSSSPKKPRTKHEPDSHSKVEEDTACGEVSSNVLGYASCDSVSVSTTRTPPVECDVVQAPDSSLNPPHLPSPIVPPQPVFFSYFEKTDNLEDYYSRRDQDSYLEEAKRLKHKADGERESTTQASVYLEAGLYFILTGISMERDRTVGSTAAFTMYKDTLVLIRYIGSRFRTRAGEFSNPMEAKIIVLSMRCQSMLSLKLFKIKMRETKEMVQYLQDHFQRHPTLDLPPVASSPQLSTPSPHSPTSSPAASSSLHPSPHHPNQIMTSIPRSIYSNMQKTCGSTMHLISAHELWEAADHLVEKYHIEDFFIQLDRQFGPLTLHNSLVDLVRYVKQALQVLKSSSELS